MHVRWPVSVTVVHADRVDLLFVTLDTVRGTNVVSEEPALSILTLASQAVGGAAGEHGGAEGG